MITASAISGQQRVRIIIIIIIIIIGRSNVSNWTGSIQYLQMHVSMFDQMASVDRCLVAQVAYIYPVICVRLFVMC